MVIDHNANRAWGSSDPPARVACVAHLTADGRRGRERGVRRDDELRGREAERRGHDDDVLAAAEPREEPAALLGLVRVHLGFGRTAASEKEAPTILVTLI